MNLFIFQEFNNVTETMSQRKAQSPTLVHALDEKHICVFCRNLLRPPIKQTLCGHRVCETPCEKEMFSGGEERVKCPGNEEDCCELKRTDVSI